DLRERQPVGEPLTPRERLAVDLACGELVLDLGDAQRTDLVLVDHQVPHGLVAGRRAAAAVVAVVVDARLFLFLRPGRGFRGTSTAANDDDVAALLAADLEDLALYLVIGDGVLGLASVADDLHGRFLVAGKAPASWQL